MKKTIILTLAVLLFGAYQEAQAYKAILKFQEDYDSCYHSFGNFLYDECANLFEVEFQAGDTVWIKSNLTQNKNCEDRYAVGFFQIGKHFNPEKYQIQDSTVIRIETNGQTITTTEIGKYGRHNEGAGDSWCWYYFVFNENLKEDITIGINSLIFNYVRTNWFFDKEICTLDRTLSANGYTSHCAIYPTDTFKVTLKEGYEIKSISIDTNSYYSFTDEYNEDIKYIKGDTPDNTWLKINEDGSINIILKGHIEIDGILVQKSAEPDLSSFGSNGYCVKIEIDITGIDETAINSKKISPNPATSSATLTLNLESAGNLRITLNDLLGKELLEIHNEFTDSGTFTRTFSTANLVKGIYYLKIFNNGGFTTEKLVIH